MRTATRIRQYVEGLPLGEPFTPSALQPYGTRAAIDQALSRMAKAELLERITRGVYVKPVTNRFVGKVMPEPRKVAEAVAATTGSVIGIQGAEAAHRLGLSTQVPTQAVFNSSGPSRRIRVGTMEIRLKHVSPRKLLLAGRPAGLAFAALSYLGRKEVTPAIVRRIQERLTTEEFAVLKSATSAMPAWMSDVILHHGEMGSDRA